MLAFGPITGTARQYTKQKNMLRTMSLTSIDGAPEDILPVGRFDIISAEEGIDAAYAVLQINGATTASFCSIDLETDYASRCASEVRFLQSEISPACLASPHTTSSGPSTATVGGSFSLIFQKK